MNPHHRNLSIAMVSVWAVMAFSYYNLMAAHGEEVGTLTKALESSASAVKVSVSATAYTARREECDDDPTVGAAGTKVSAGTTLAVSRDIYPALKGKTVWLEGFGFRKIEDSMHPRWKKKCDVLVVGLSAARDFGRKGKLSMVVVGD